MSVFKRLTVFSLIGGFVFLMGCGGEGPLGNTPPQGRPDWMKKPENPPAPPSSPQQQ